MQAFIFLYRKVFFKPFGLLKLLILYSLIYPPYELLYDIIIIFVNNRIIKPDTSRRTRKLLAYDPSSFSPLRLNRLD